MNTVITAIILLLGLIIVCIYVSISVCKILYNSQKSKKDISEKEMYTIIKGLLILFALQLLIWLVISDTVDFFINS